MKKLAWFILGVAFAAAAIVLVWQPSRGIRPLGEPATATSAPSPTPPDTPVPPVPTSTSEPTDTPVPSATSTSVPSVTPSHTTTPVSVSLAWSLEGGIGGFCARLSLSEDDSAVHGDCGGTRIGQLTSSEMADYLGYVTLFAPFESDVQNRPGRPDNMIERLRFVGLGPRMPDDDERAEIALWSGQVYARLEADEREHQLVMLSRLHLAGRLGVTPEEIRLLSIEQVTWPDTCLGLPGAGRGCLAALTPGLDILFEAQGLAHEYRTDLRSLVRPVEVIEPTPTLSPAPTYTLWPTYTPQPQVITDWRGEYYANPDLWGPPVVVRNDGWVTFSWGPDAPSPRLPSDRFSVRWSRRLWFDRGTYRFTLHSDDGIRLWVDGTLYIDRWRDGYEEDVVERYVLQGAHEIVVEYYENEGLAEIDLFWERLTTVLPTAEIWGHKAPGEISLFLLIVIVK